MNGSAQTIARFKNNTLENIDIYAQNKMSTGGGVDSL